MKIRYEVAVLESALVDIQAAIDFYDDQQLGLGVRFEQEMNQYLVSLESMLFYQMRYGSIRCLPLKRFPFMIHFNVDEDSQTVCVFAVLHTSLNPDNWQP